MRRALGRKLALFRESAGLTQTALAREVRYDKTSVRHIEAGRQGVARPVWERFDGLLKAGGALLAAFDEFSSARSDWDRVRPVVDLVETTFGPGARILTDGSVSDVRDAAVQWLVSTSPSGASLELTTRPGPQASVGQADVDRLQAMRDQFKALDNQCGGVAVFPLIADCVRHQVRPLLRGRYRDVTGNALLRIAAQMILDAGWAAYDADAQPYARRCMRAALRLADTAGDRLFGGRVLAALAHQSLHVGRHQEAVDLATAALHGTGRIAGPRAVAMFESMVACATASIGDRRSCELALSRASSALDRADTHRDGLAWLDFDHGGLAGHAARAYRDLGHPSRARRFAAEAIDLCQDSHVRTQVQRKAILATALVSAGETDHACAVGQDLLNHARTLRSALVVSDLRKLSGLLGAAGAAGEFREHVRQLAPAHGQPAVVVWGR